MSLLIQGIDVFVIHSGLPKVPEKIGALKLVAISNRGTRIWPNVNVHFELTDVHQCRYLFETSQPVPSNEVSSFLSQVEKAGFSWVQVEKLLEIDGKAGFSAVHGD